MIIMYNMIINIMSMLCPKCNYSWVSRVKSPKACPLCKQYLKILVMRPDEVRLPKKDPKEYMQPVESKRDFDIPHIDLVREPYEDAA